MSEPHTLAYWCKKAHTRQWIISILERRIDRLEAELRTCACTKGGNK